MNSKLFIAGDWGTSHLRLFLCEYRDSAAAAILDSLKGPGVSQVNGNFESVFFELCADWISAHSQLPVIISGMAGSSIGWREAPYIACPATSESIARGRLSFDARGHEVSIISGLKTINPLGAPDVMRGEELQLMGWMQANQTAESDHPGSVDRLFALPGTHNKWAWMQQGRIDTFLTALTGELFALLKNHSVLIADKDSSLFDQAAFFAGVHAIEKLQGGSLIHALFSTRSEQLLSEMPASSAASYLSGLLIAADVMGAINLFEEQTSSLPPVVLIGESMLCERYQLVLNHLQIEAEFSDPAEIAMAGFAAVYKQIYIG